MKCCLYGLVGGRGSLYTYNHREAAVFQFLELERLVLLLILGLELVAEFRWREGRREKGREGAGE